MKLNTIGLPIQETEKIVVELNVLCFHIKYFEKQSKV